MIVVTFVNRRWASSHSAEPAIKRIVRAVIDRAKRKFPDFADIMDVKFVAPQDICKWIAEHDSVVTGKDQRSDIEVDP